MLAKRGRCAPRRRTPVAVLLVAVASAMLIGCDVEEQLRLAQDGTGSYRARVTVDHTFAGTLGRLKQRAERGGFQIVEEESSQDGQSIVFARDFDDVSELNADSASYRFEVERRSPLRSLYRLTVELREDLLASGFDRRLVIRLPARIRESSAGEVSGESVVWDCSDGGTLVVEAEGFGPSLAWRLAAASTGLLAVGMVAGAVRWLRRSRPVCRR